MVDFSNYDPDSLGNPNNNIFGLPTTEEGAKLVILPVPWEVTVSYGAGTARSSEAVLKASLQVDLYDSDYPESWKHGYYILPTDKKLLMKSDFLRKEAELYIDYISRGDVVSANQFISKTIREVNEGSVFMNTWVYDRTKALLNKGKLVGLLGGDHSTSLGFFKGIAEKHGDFGILQIDAHCDLRIAYEDFNYSHASIMYNALKEIPQINRIVQIGVRDYSEGELNYIQQSNSRVVCYFEKDIKEKMYEGQTWKNISDDIVNNLPEKVVISFDIDGLDPKLCPNTGTPVHGGFETEQLFYLFNKILKSGRKIIGFDLVEIGVGESDWDANVGARILFKLCNLLVASDMSAS